MIDPQPSSTRRFASHGHHRLSYEIVTTDPISQTQTLVLLHALLAGHGEFAALRTALTSTFNLLLPDARGHGASAAIPDQRYTIQTAASELDAILDDAGAGRVHLLGHDLGGATAIAYATVRPERIRSLAVIDPALPQLLADDPDPSAAAAYKEAAEADVVSADTAYKGVTERAVDQYIGPRFGPDWRATASKPVLGTIKRHAAALAGSLAALAVYTPDTHRLGSLSVPITIFATAGARPITHYTNQRLAECLPGSSLVELPAGAPDDPFRSPRGEAAAAIADVLRIRSTEA